MKGLSKDYHLLLQLKLGYGKFAMIRTPGDFVACTTMLNKTWSLDVPHYEKTSTRWLWTVYTGLFWSPTTNKTPLNWYIGINSVKTSIIFIEISLMSRSISRWDSHFYSYMLNIYVCPYWLWELIVFNSLVSRGYIRKFGVQLVPKYIFHMISVLIVFHAANKKNQKKKY